MLSNYYHYRLYEILPGLSIWLTIIGSVVLSFIKPLWMIYFILIFDVYWVLRVIYFSFYLFLSWRRFREAIKVSWFENLTKEFPLWEKRKNVIFLPVYNEGWEVLESTLNSFLASTYPAAKIYLLVSGEERKVEHWQQMQKRILENYSGKFADLIFYTHPGNLPDEIPGKGSNIHYAEM